ncbi:hypothetical protein BKP37_13405 [Anaerobacillus alkalilacustris]|uniref:Uncharacterized protein n=1 Tax=Anaerobacillus alkalilacustris TaxID=393763 RepID=A0A1S2LIV0_9BACI|nr:hypothetical protein [Anaerobacillus alkalilacustris]OIJ12432.1 hypothetical protein BKP37_13405 [Anaerobacillus alkalilacustris]
MVRWLLLSVVGVACITVWFMVLHTFIVSEKTLYSQPIQISSLQNTDEEPTTDPWEEDVLKEQKEIETTNDGVDIITRGIRKGDFVKYAPDGVISIDVLLSIINKDQH